MNQILNAAWKTLFSRYWHQHTKNVIKLHFCLQNRLVTNMPLVILHEKVIFENFIEGFALKFKSGGLHYRFGDVYWHLGQPITSKSKVGMPI